MAKTGKVITHYFFGEPARKALPRRVFLVSLGKRLELFTDCPELLFQPFGALLIFALLLFGVDSRTDFPVGLRPVVVVCGKHLSKDADRKHAIVGVQACVYLPGGGKAERFPDFVDVQVPEFRRNETGAFFDHFALGVRCRAIRRGAKLDLGVQKHNRLHSARFHHCAYCSPGD